MKLSIQSKIKLKDFLFYMAIIFYCADYYISASLFDYMLPKTLSLLIRLLVLVCLGLMWICTEKYTVRKFICIFIIMVSAAIVAFTGQYISLLLFMCVVISSTNIDFEKVIKLLEINIWIWAILIIFSCLIGLLNDYTYAHYVGNTLYTAHSLGFKYYGWLGYTAMALSMMWVYRHRGASFIQSLIIIVLNYGFYKIHSTNLPLIITILFVVFCYLAETRKIINLKAKVWKLMATVIPGGLYMGTWVFIIRYRNGKVFMTLPILRTIVARMKFSVRALEQYGLHFFGTHVTQVGNVDIYYGNASATNAIYIDSGYVYSTIAYGLIFTIILLVIYTWIGIYLYNKNENILFIWLLALMFACCINNFMCDIINNPIILLLPSAILSVRKRKKIKGVKI